MLDIGFQFVEEDLTYCILLEQQLKEVCEQNCDFKPDAAAVPSQRGRLNLCELRGRFACGTAGLQGSQNQMSDRCSVAD